MGGDGGDQNYERDLRRAQLAMVRWQQHAMEKGEKVLVIFEGRDAAGKDGTIKRIIEHLSVRATRVVALAKPTDKELGQWFFQRYVAHLPTAGELVIFNRSWYNRAGVERVMGFTKPDDVECFLKTVPVFEEMLATSDLRLLKVWLDVSKKEQAARLKERKDDPLKVLKASPLDQVAQSKFDDYTRARDEMLTRTSTDCAPWYCVRADNKKPARLNVMRGLVHALAPKGIAREIEPPDPDVLFRFEPQALQDGRLAR
jgi:polyphosphate kinase 2